jgi:hypothetical protein
VSAFLTLAICIGLMSTVVGCGRGGSHPSPASESHLKALAVFYGRYVQRHQGKTPPDEAAFKKFLAGLRPEERGGLLKGTVDELFLSPRDKQPYVVRYNVAVSAPGPKGAPVIAYEQSGASGKRYVATALGSVELMTADQLRQLVPDAK